MMRALRHDRLLEHLRLRGTSSVTELVEALDSSAATIRRDLDQLSQSGLLERTWGGARLVTGEDDPFAEALQDHSEAKTAMARLASLLVRDGDTLFLDIGTSTHYLASALRHRELTVITASLPVYDILHDCPGIKLVLLGGDYSPQYQCLEGSNTVEAASRYTADIAFIGCSGITPRGQVRDTSDAQVQVKRALARAASRRVLLADASKFPGQGSAIAFGLDAVDVLVSDQPINTAHLDADTIPDDTKVMHP